MRPFATTLDINSRAERVWEWACLSVEFSGVLAPLVAWFAGDLTDRYLQMEAAGLERRSEAG